MKGLSFLLLLLSLQALAQKGPVFIIDSLPKQGIVLDQGWKWHAGDDLAWAKPDFDDSNWASIDPTKDINTLPEISNAGRGWLRIHLSINPALSNTVASLAIDQAVASAIYHEGHLIGRFGKIDLDTREIKAYNPFSGQQLKQVIHIYTGNKQEQVLAVRFAIQPKLHFKRFYGWRNPCLMIFLFKSDPITDKYPNSYDYEKRGEFYPGDNLDYIKFGLFFIMGLLHLFYYFSYPSQKANLYFSLYCWLGDAMYLYQPITNQYLHFVSDKFFYRDFHWFAIELSGIFLLMAVYRLFNYPKGIIFKAITISTILFLTAVLINLDVPSYIGLLITITAFADAARVSVIAYLHKKDGALILVIGNLIWAIGMVLYIYTLPSNPYLGISLPNHLVVNLALVSVPISITLFLAREFTQTAKALAQRLKDVEALALEKQQILSTQNETLEYQVKERTEELSLKNRELAIEAALERVRVRAMAMHKSEELQDVVNSIFEQFIVLKIEISTANILVFSETSQDMKCWTSNYNNRSFHIPFANVTVLKDLHQAKQNGQKLLSKSYTIEEKNQLFEYFFERTDFRDIPEDRQKQILLSDKYALSSAFSGKVAVQLTSYSRDSFFEDENKILLRFSEVFFQAFTRFLDLQKAEVQAREAQIEAALERVRGRSMAMYKSEELAEVAAVLFQQIRLLGELPDRLSIGLFEEEKGWAQVWTTDQTGFQINGRFFARLTEETSVQKMYSCWKSGQNTQVIVLQEEEFKKWLRFVREELKIEVDATRFKGQRVHNIAYFSQGWLDVLSLEPISTEMLGILLRFATVFNLSYTRFLDLQMAEKQAREAIIEAALERVRAEIASMRTSNDLQRITPLIWKELTTLQVPFIR